MATPWFQAIDSFRNIFLQDGGVMAAPNAVVTNLTGAGVTVPTASLVNVINATGAVTAAILAAGTYNCQIAIVVNESTVVANSITFSTTLATGLVLTDATPDANVIKAASASAFIWLSALNGGNGAWVKFGPFGG